MTKKKRVILLSVMTMMLCLALVASGTYALFTDDVTLTTHLKSGTMDITLTRVHLEKYVLNNDTGYLDHIVNEKDIDFSSPNDENVFDIHNVISPDAKYTELIVPGCSYTATMEIYNGTDVAYVYWIEVVAADPDNIALAEQLQVTVYADDETVISQNLSKGFMLGSEMIPIASLPKGTTDTFQITLEFLDLTTNNAAKSQNLSFDIIVHAVQDTGIQTP